MAASFIYKSNCNCQTEIKISYQFHTHFSTVYAKAFVLTTRYQHIQQYIYHMLRSVLLRLHLKNFVKILASPQNHHQIHSFSSQKRQEDTKLQILECKQSNQTFLAFMSWTFLWKLNYFQPTLIYANGLNSYQQSLLNEMKVLKSGIKQEQNKLTSKTRAKFLQAYEIGQGVQISSKSGWSGSQECLAVFNPTSLTVQLLRNCASSSIIVGNSGIGKTYNLLNLQYLSYHRFKLLYQDATMREIAKLVCTNKQSFNIPHGMIQKRLNNKIQGIIQEFKQQPLIVYYDLEVGESWENFYEKLVRQFPYLQETQYDLPKLKEGQNEQIFKQNLLKYKSELFCSKLNSFFSQLARYGFKNVSLKIDQANNYVQLLNQYNNMFSNKPIDKAQGFIQWLTNTQQDNNSKQYLNTLLNSQIQSKVYAQKDQRIKFELNYKLRLMSEQISLLKSIGIFTQYYFSDSAQLAVFKSGNANKQIQRFEKLIQNQIDYKSKGLLYGFDISTSFGQNQMFTIFTLFLQQTLANLAKCNNKAKVIQAIRSLGIQEMISRLRKGRMFQNNTTPLTLAKALRELQTKGKLTQIVQILDSYVLDRSDKVWRQFRDAAEQILQICVGYQYLVFKGQDWPLRRHLKPILNAIQKLKPGQGIGARPVDQIKSSFKKQPYTDTLFVCRNQKNELCLTTFEYMLGKDAQQIQNKLIQHRQLYESTLLHDHYFIGQFGQQNYCHYLVVQDQAYYNYRQKKYRKRYIAKPYQKIIRASQIDSQIAQIQMAGWGAIDKPGLNAAQFGGKPGVVSVSNFEILFRSSAH